MCVCVCVLLIHRHKFINNELIVKHGLVDKRKVGRVTETPHLTTQLCFLLLLPAETFKTATVYKIIVCCCVVCLQGLFAKRRQLILTDAPRLYYIDPVDMELKGEIPWSEALQVEQKNWKIFFIHTVSTHIACCH